MIEHYLNDLMVRSYCMILYFDVIGAESSTRAHELDGMRYREIVLHTCRLIISLSILVT